MHATRRSIFLSMVYISSNSSGGDRNRQSYGGNERIRRHNDEDNRQSRRRRHSSSSLSPPRRNNDDDNYRTSHLSSSDKKQIDFWNRRRVDRSNICKYGLEKVWGLSPDRIEIEHIYTMPERTFGGITEEKHNSDEEKSKKRNKSDKKKKRKKEKRSKKSSKKRKRSSTDDGAESASASETEQWEEITKETIDQQQSEEKEEDANMIGPQLPFDMIKEAAEPVNPAIYGKDMLKGEAAAMAAYIAQGKRIPRRGEIGLSSGEISEYEKVGYVMSGARHKSMEATRLRKENQVYSAEEKRMLSGFTHEERKKKESGILGQFRDLISKKMNTD